MQMKTGNFNLHSNLLWKTLLIRRFTTIESSLEELMNNLKEENLDSAPQHTPAVGELVAAKFTEDDTWYRASVKSNQGDSKFLVFYVDYGNVSCKKKRAHSKNGTQKKNFFSLV